MELSLLCAIMSFNIAMVQSKYNSKIITAIQKFQTQGNNNNIYGINNNNNNNN